MESLSPPLLRAYLKVWTAQRHALLALEAALDVWQSDGLKSSCSLHVARLRHMARLARHAVLRLVDDDAVAGLCLAFPTACPACFPTGLFGSAPACETAAHHHFSEGDDAAHEAAMQAWYTYEFACNAGFQADEIERARRLHSFHTCETRAKRPMSDLERAFVSLQIRPFS
jgi:hypothetical protein